MDAVILAGGRGSRLYPLTLNRSKVELPLVDRSMLAHQLRRVRKAGLDSVTVVTGRAAQEGVREELEQRLSTIEWHVVVQPEPEGIADALLWARPNVSSERFVLLLADNIFTAPLQELWEGFDLAEASGRLWVTQVDTPSNYGIVETDGGSTGSAGGARIERLVEKPKTTSSKLAICGAYLLPQSVFELAEELRPEDDGEFEITPVLMELHEREGLEYRLTPGEWEDAGTLNGFLRAQWTLLKRRSSDRFIHSSATLRGTDIEGPVWIGPHCQVEDAELGPNVVLAGSCTVRGAEIRNSALLDGVRLVSEPAGGRVERSLIGRAARLQLLPAVYEGVMLADFSELVSREPGD